MITIIAEKPSVARQISRVVGATQRKVGYYGGNGYCVTWVFGHLVQLAMPEAYGIKGFRRESLPIVPDDFKLVIRQGKNADDEYGVQEQIKVIKNLFEHSDSIIVATDAGREGELIFRYLYQYLDCHVPFQRLWISSLTDKAIKDGMNNLRDGHDFDNLYLSAKARSEADWLVGINATQALTIAAGKGTYSLGRVQTPTLAMVCRRFLENKDFVPTPFWQMHFTSEGDGKAVKFLTSERWNDKEVAEALYQQLKGNRNVVISKVECKEKTEGLVPEMLKEAPFPPLVIANALYYKAEWGVEFDKEFKEMPFHGVSADAKASFFGKKALFIYNDFNNIQLLSIPYGNGSYDLVVALPASGSTTADALKALGSTEGREFLAEFGISGNGLNGELVEVLLPKFEIKSRYEDVADVLQALGATTPFSAKDADFSNISEKRVYIDRIIQEAVVNVDEKGTEAAAVTLNLMAYSAGPGSEPPVKQFIADRPFVFFIREKGSNAILFMGVKNN